MEVGCAGVGGVGLDRISLGAGSCSRLPHSVSANEVSRLPPRDIQRSATKMLAIRVRMLDENVTLFQVQAKALGKVLFEQVCKQLNLLEADYFGLEYQDEAGIRYWLDLEKSLQRQVGLSLVEPMLQFCVKFYPADPTQLEEEYTRYLFCLQVKRDLRDGHMQCNDNTAALMASYIVQAECGDYVAEDYPDPSYLSSYKFVQHQDRDLERKIMENHKKHVGQSPAEADLNLLETARRCELYGIKMHPAKDHEGGSLNLAVAHMGILVFLNYNKVNTFSWAKIRKISFKRKKFLIKLHPEGYSTPEFQGYHKDMAEFFFDTRNECKNLWKKCVEHHGFFRCSSVKRVQRQRARVLSRGSSFRYSGRTQKQIVEYVRENYVKRQTFQRSSPLSRCIVGRSQSFRAPSSVHSSVANVGASISAHPLIPVGDTTIASVASCESTVVGSPSQTYRVDLMTHTHSSLQSNQLTQPTSTQHHHTGLLLSYKQYNTTSSQTDIVDTVDCEYKECSGGGTVFSWQRSASCKELRKSTPLEGVTVMRRLEPDPPPRVYSSSYPGTTSSLSTESGGADNDTEPCGAVAPTSHDDLSHDSYELLDRETQDYIQSLDSSHEEIPQEDEDVDDELFVMDDFPEPDPFPPKMGFSEFNEKCKQGFARHREHGRVEFKEFESKHQCGLEVGGYTDPEAPYPVERTKSDPYVSDFWRVAKQHRRLYHQKSFDLTPDTSGDDSRPSASKSTADIPYTLSVKPVRFDSLSPSSPKRIPDHRKVEVERKKSSKLHVDKLAKTKHNSDLNSQDSGLSMSLGNESTDEINELSSKNSCTSGSTNTKIANDDGFLKPKKDLLKVKSEDAPRRKGLLGKTKALSADSGLKKCNSFDKPPVEVIRIDSEEGEGGLVIRSTTDDKISVDTTDPDVIIVEYRGNRRRAFQKRNSSGSRESFDKGSRSEKGSIDYPKYEGGQEERIKEWQGSFQNQDSTDSSVDGLDFKRDRYSKEVKTSIEGKVVRETREEREMKKQKSDEFVDLRDRPKIQLPPKGSSLEERSSGYCTCMANKRTDSFNASFEVKRPKDRPSPDSLDLITPYVESSKYSDTDEPVFDEPSPRPVVEPEEPEKGELTLQEVVLEVKAEGGKVISSPEKAWKKFDELSAAIASKRERSPVLFARLGFSEGSVFSPNVTSPSSSRRAKSLDAPVVSLHRLPPVTSFSSKDDTMNDEESTEMDEKNVRSLMGDVIQEEDSTYLSSGPDSLTKIESPLPDGPENDGKVRHPYSDYLESRGNETRHFDEQEVPRSPSWQVTNRKGSDSVPVAGDSRRESQVDVPTSPVPERRPSTRTERIDSFKNTKNYSVDLWTSEENDNPGSAPVDDVDMEAYDDAFIDPPDAVPDILDQIERAEEPSIEEESSVSGAIPADILNHSNINFEFSENVYCNDEEFNILVTPPRIPSIETSSASFDDQQELPSKPDMPSLELMDKLEDTSGSRLIPNKRSFDEDPSSSSSLKPDSNNRLKPFSFESSGSSSLEEGIFPPDDSAHFADEEEGSSNSNQDDYPTIGPVGAELILGGYTGGVFGLSRTLSRISERSTTSEQERSDYEDDVSTKASSRSLSVEDESMLSSDRQPSLSSDPSVNVGAEERHDATKLDFKIPPPLLPSEEEWPSPPNSNFQTPVITNVEAFYLDMKPQEPTTVIFKDPKDKEEEESSDSECENKTLHEDEGPDSSAFDTLKVACKHKKTGNSSDVSDFSSSTGTTVKHCHYHSNAAKSDDSSLADFGSSLSTEMLASSRKNSDDSMCHKKRTTFFVLQRSFDDYDSPYTESDDNSRGGSYGPSTNTHTLKKCAKGDRRNWKCCMFDGQPLERKMTPPKGLGRSKCYSYYSLARSPPSDGSSSSLELAEPPLTPNTIPRVSKRRRHVAKRHRPPAPRPDPDPPLAASSPSITSKRQAHPKQFLDKSPMSKQSSV